jgi:fermentation-respiration switch protein FrsA (DUF1100 family)
MPILIIFFILLLLLLGAGFYAAAFAVYPKVLPFEKTFQHELENNTFKEADYLAYPKQEIEVKSPFGYTLSGTYIPNGASKKTAILCHGITLSRYNMVKYIPMFYKRGFNVLIYDHRHHGKSGGRNTTFGYFEKHDLKAMVDWALAQLGEGGIVGTLGESLGGATVLQHAAIDPRLAFVVADCAYSDFMIYGAYRGRQDFHLPPFPLILIANWWSGLLTGMTFDKVSPLKELPGVKTPILFTTGATDTYIPPEMSRAMYAAKVQGIRKLLVVPEAKHAQAFLTDPALYDKTVGEFLSEIGLATA